MVDHKNLKTACYELAAAWVNTRIESAQKAMQNAQNSANEESKSSAGDKYETGRAMAQNDRDMFAKQHLEAQQDLNVLQKINVDIVPDKVVNGALVNTSMGYFFIALSIGHKAVASQNIMFTSALSPIGALIYGKSVGESFQFRNQAVSITGIY